MVINFLIKLITRKLTVSTIRGKMKFSANISTMFSDLETLNQRYEYLLFNCPVKFEAIECQDPYQLSIDDWKKLFESCRQRGVNQLPKWDLINSPPLFTSFPDYQQNMPSFDEFKKTVLDKTLQYAKFLGVKKVHLILGDIQKSSADDKVDSVALDKMINLLKQSAKLFADEKITVVIEPLSIRDHYYLRSYKLAKSIINQAKQNNLRVMLDIYHLQRLEGNITDNVKSVIPVTGHVQISQVPLRDGPFNDGEVNYNYVLKLLSPLYSDYIGLEYKNTTKDSLQWIEKFV